MAMKFSHLNIKLQMKNLINIEVPIFEIFFD